MSGGFTGTDHDLEERLARRDRRRLALAFGGAALLHASTALGLAYWQPPEPVAPPGELVVTLDLEPAALSNAQVQQAGVTQESVPQQAAPPEPPQPEAKEEEVVEEQVEPTPEPVAEEEIAEPPRAEEAEVVIAPKEKKTEKKKAKPKPSTPSPAAAAAARPKDSDVSGRGASASPSEINAYAGRVRAAIERNKKSAPAGSTGRVHIAFVISRSGTISGLRLAQSSGNPTLDAVARAAVANAHIPPIPEGLPAPLPFGVPINFR